VDDRAAHGWLEDAENGRQLRSQLTKILNVPQGYVSGFVSSAASLDDHFEHPEDELDGMMN
jgi:hypothetical protein